jgi:DNA-binding NarL/FixJ family response regulator
MSEQIGGRIIRVGLADDQRLLRDGLRIILQAAPDIAVVGEAEDGVAAVELAVSTQPDVLLLDIRMPRLDGIEAARRIAQVAPATRVVLLTTFDAPDLVAEGVQAGVAGFLLKDSSADELRAAVRAVARGQLLFQGQGAAQLLAGATPPAAPPSLGNDFGLTERELEVLRRIAEGKTNAEIAAELVVSEATVKTHINHIFAKLGARDRAHAILLAQRHHLA